MSVGSELRVSGRDSRRGGIRAGRIALMEPTQLRERFLQAAETARGLLADFRQAIQSQPAHSSAASSSRPLQPPERFFVALPAFLYRVRLQDESAAFLRARLSGLGNSSSRGIGHHVTRIAIER